MLVLQGIDLRIAFRRWAAFNLVGLMGVGVQMFTLVALRTCTGMHYLVATGLAVEAAVLHNFLWHERWTWSDRTASDSRRSLARLVRFNLTTGVISIGENLLFMALLVSGLEVHYVPGNLITIGICSVLNFRVSDRLVFRNGGHTSAPKYSGSQIHNHSGSE